MEMHTNKKESVFSGIFPSNEPAPSPAMAHQAPRPAVAEEQVAALNKKIELMERSIAGQIEKKIAEQVPLPLPPPPPGLAPAVLLKMTEMENRLKDFQDKFLLGASQLKNIEESKIGARREIEELLKVVREQQKYTELDRQMHDQLEKAWLRVEEMEKRMMEVYSAAAKKPAEPTARVVSPEEIAAVVMKAVDAGLEERLKPLETALKNAAAKKPAEPPARVVSPAEIAAEVLKALDARLEGRLAPLEAMLKNAAAKSEAATVTSHGIEGRVAELSAAVDLRLAGFSSEIRQLHIEAFAGKERVEDILVAVKKDVLSSVSEAFTDGSGAFLKHIDAAAIDGRERMDSLSKSLVSHMDELAARGRDNALEIGALENCIRSGNEKTLSAVLSVQHGLEKALCAHIDEAAARVMSENTWQLEKIREAYGLSASNTAAIAAVAKNISGIEESLGGVMAGLKAFVKALEPVNIEAILGVSGAIIRRSFDTAGKMVAGLEKETVLLARAKGEIEANLKSLASKPGGEGK